ncbi:MAG: DUF2871 domain-containing protein [Pseudoflavonifractor sp.]
MKKMINLSFLYAILAMVGGVFYREFTKFNGFSGRTTLGFVHGHLFLLGMVVFLVVALFCHSTKLAETKPFGGFLVAYNIGLPLTAIMFVVRGIPQVLGMELSKGMSAAISGIAGLGHIILGVGIVMLLLALRKVAAQEKA